MEGATASPPDPVSVASSTVSAAGSVVKKLKIMSIPHQMPQSIQMSSVETGQMSAETGQMSVIETRQMSTIETGPCPVSVFYIFLVSTAGICPVSTEDIQPVSTEDITAAGRRLATGPSSVETG